MFMSFVQLSVYAHTNHTTLTLRSHGYNLAREITTFTEISGRRDDDTKGRSLQLIGFYQASHSAPALGRYFGMNNHNQMLLGHTASGAALDGADLDCAYLIHEASGSASQASITLKPTTESYGMVLTSFHNLEKIMDGLYMSMNIPVVYMTNNMHMSISDVTGNATVANITNFFNGTFTGINTSANAQQPLKYAKISEVKSQTGIADIESKLGYNVVDQEDYRWGVNVGWTTATGNKNNGFYVWQPIVGNGGHTALGVGSDAMVMLWSDNQHNIKLSFAVDYRYLFENDEYRTFGIKESDGTVRNWGQYHLLAQPIVGGANGVVLSPAANHTTLNCAITPGNQVEGLTNIAYNGGNLSLDIGYNFFWRAKESLRIKGSYDTFSQLCGVANRATDASDGSQSASTYGNTSGSVAAGVLGTLERQFDENHASTNTASGAANMKWLSLANLNSDSAITPAVLTHKIYAGVGGVFRDWYLPILVGIGGSYELASKNSAPDYWSVYAKASIGF